MYGCFKSAAGMIIAGAIAVAGSASGVGAAGANEGPSPKTFHLPEVSFHYTDDTLPAIYRTATVRRFDNTPADNPITDAGATLGRVLFYDTRLSASDTVSCSSCHQQQHAFSDTKRFSIGHRGGATSRNAMPLVEVRYYARGRFFWDERAATLEEQVLIPVQNKVEMGQELNTVVGVLRKDSAYPALFEKAFGDRRITAERTSKALSQFVRSLVSYRSKYDEGLALAGFPQADFPNFTTQENRGKAIFLRRCGICHLPPSAGVVLSMQDARNNGLDADDGVTDLGVADVTGRRRHMGLFKSPSLRNVEYTAPYMHDGRFATLKQVVEHYSNGVKAAPNLDPRLRGPGPMRLAPAQQAALVAFLKTLSDQAFITDPKFSDPFVR